MQHIAMQNASGKERKKIGRQALNSCNKTPPTICSLFSSLINEVCPVGPVLVRVRSPEPMCLARVGGVAMAAEDVAVPEESHQVERRRLVAEQHEEAETGLEERNKTESSTIRGSEFILFDEAHIVFVCYIHFCT